MNIVQFVQDKLGVTARREERLRRRVFDGNDLRPPKMHPSNRPPRKWWGK